MHPRVRDEWSQIAALTVYHNLPDERPPMFAPMSPSCCCAAAAGLRTLGAGGSASGTWLTALDWREMRVSADVAASAIELRENDFPMGDVMLDIPGRPECLGGDAQRMPQVVSPLEEQWVNSTNARKPSWEYSEVRYP
jgi:hypothetical protein